MDDAVGDWIDDHLTEHSLDVSMLDVWRASGNAAAMANKTEREAALVLWNLLVNEQDEAARLAEMGAKATVTPYTDYRGHTGDGLIKGGYQVLLDALATAAGGAKTIQLGDAVTHVAQGSCGAPINSSLYCVSTAAGKHYTAGGVVVTLPLAVLQRGDVTFNPPLPAKKAAAIRMIGAGKVTKVLARLKPGSGALNLSHYSLGQLPPASLGFGDMVGSCKCTSTSHVYGSF